MGEAVDTAHVPDVARRTDPPASPARGTNGDGLAGIAPALVITCDHDKLRAEAVAYAGQARGGRQAGGRADPTTGSQVSRTLGEYGRRGVGTCGFGVAT
nr:alpha/beta hydrolase fold domain-containing protein [Amycolatopsis sp. RTGN1]